MRCLCDTARPHRFDNSAVMSKKISGSPIAKPSGKLLEASYNAGFADGRLKAIEESMDAVAALVFKVETMIAGLGENPDRVLQDNATHTLRALNVAFAAVTGSVNGSAAFQSLLEQSRQRQLQNAASMH